MWSEPSSVADQYIELMAGLSLIVLREGEEGRGEEEVTMSGAAACGAAAYNVSLESDLSGGGVDTEHVIAHHI